MIHFHGAGKRKPFFEGWYFKHQADGFTAAFIPGMSVDSSGRRSAFLQILTEYGAYQADYDYSLFSADRNRLRVRVGNSLFTDQGAELDIRTENFSCRGRIYYGSLTPLASDIMGPVGLLPFLECRHGILSMGHRLGGALTVDGKTVRLSGGRGYIEKDWGSAFPRQYCWFQCNRFPGEDVSVAASAARVPLLGGAITGCFCVFCYRGKEYRLATYNGATLLRGDENRLVIRRGGQRLEVWMEPGGSHPLRAPGSDGMCRTVWESPRRPAAVRYFENGNLLFEGRSDSASYEFLGPPLC